MNRKIYIQTLRQQLTNLTELERAEILADYEEHFDIGISKGKSEAEIATKLGDPRKIFKEIKVQSAIRKAESETTFSNISGAVFATISLSFFNLVFILGPFIGIAGVLVGLVVTSIALVISGPVGIASVLLSPLYPNIVVGVHPVAAILICIGITTLGLLLLIMNYYLVKYFFILTIRYLKLNFNLVKKSV